MDLIYANAQQEDIGVLRDYKLDMAYGESENDFELQIPTAAHCCKDGYYLYIEGTDYGGVVDSIKSNTGEQEVTYTGRTWHGLLDSKVIKPDAGEDYLVVSGEANAVIGSLISRIGLSALFAASTENSGLTISSYQMNRYIHAYEGIRKMLKTVGGKLRFTFTGGKVVLSAHPRGDYAQNGEIDSDVVDFTVQQHYHAVNHLVCLGRGELKDREVIDLYVGADGTISKTQTFTGVEEREDVYDNPNVESLEDLEEKGRERLEELAQPDEIEADLDDGDDQYDVQDLVGATDNVTGLAATAEIVKKIITIESGQVTISYKVGV